MIRYLLLLPVALVFAAMMPTGCGSSTSCMSICNDSQSQNCSHITGDCGVFCGSLDKILDVSTCETQFDNYALCLSQDEICTGDSRCSGQRNAFVGCVAAYCLGNTGNTDCQTVTVALK